MFPVLESLLVSASSTLRRTRTCAHAQNLGILVGGQEQSVVLFTHTCGQEGVVDAR